MKMGKSLGNTLEPKDLVERFGADAVRYFFLREVEFGNDGDYSEERFINIVNAHLANTIGILLKYICFCNMYILFMRAKTYYAFCLLSSHSVPFNYVSFCVNNNDTILLIWIGNLLNRTLGLLKKNCKSTLVFDSIAAADGVPLRENVENLVSTSVTGVEDLMINHKFWNRLYKDLANLNRNLHFLIELIPYLYITKAKTFNSSELLSGLQLPCAWSLLPYFVWYTPRLQYMCNAIVSFIS